MTLDQYMRALNNPYWCSGSPLAWKADGIGISHFALEGHVGRFNLCYLMMQRTEPPLTREAYIQTNLSWVILHSGACYVKGQTLEHHASLRTLRDFRDLILPVTEIHLGAVGAIPWYDINKALRGVAA